eukprot:m.198868 g.198868  ORF g.198868 m.198868 type:complete len:111 (+) comp25154_c0_seq1:299-631(+)
MFISLCEAHWLRICRRVGTYVLRCALCRYETLIESLQSPSGIVLLLLMLGIAVGAAVRVSSPSGGRQLGSSGATHANRFSNGAHRAMVDDRILSSAAEAAQLRRRAPGSS